MVDQLDRLWESWVKNSILALVQGGCDNSLSEDPRGGAEHGTCNTDHCDTCLNKITLLLFTLGI